MTDWLPQIVKIEKVTQHPNADALDIVTVLGDYPVVVKRGEYKIDQFACYLPIDTIVPDTEQYYFLCPKAYEKYEDSAGVVQQRQIGPKYPVGSVPEKYRILKAKKIRNVYSQGMLVPVPKDLVHQPGDSVVDLLNLKKWEEEEEDNLPNAKRTYGANAEKPPVGWSIPYYDVEGLRKYISCLGEDEEIVLTEKIHGCLKHDTKIMFANGVKKPICQIKVGDELLGVDDLGKIVPSTVIKTFNNGVGNNWIKIKGTRNNSGRGGNMFSITCTTEHRFFSPISNDYIRANQLKVGDEVYILRSDYSLTPIQEQVLLGKLLGDANIYNHSSCSSLINWGHSVEFTEYFDWTCKAIGSLNSGARENYLSGFGTNMIRGRTVSSNLIKEKFSSFVKNSKKIIPNWIIEELTPLAIAFWYMDDGSLSHNEGQEDRVHFAVCDFTEEDCNILQQALLKFNINSVYYTSSNKNNDKEHSHLRLNAQDAEKLFLLIAPYIPSIMQYKLPERYRGHNGWMPSSEEFKQPLVKQIITSIESLGKVKSNKYDIETSTHNYFANGILVHNSNAAFCHDGEKLWVKSRNFYKKMDEDDPWWDIAIRYDLSTKLSQFPMKVFFGELYGQIKGFRYDCELVAGAMHSRIRFFDIFDAKSNIYLDYDEFYSITSSINLDVAPLLYRGKWLGKEEMYPYAEGLTTLGGKHVREGFVLRTVKERFEPKLNSRMVIKLVGEGYNLTK